MRKRFVTLNGRLLPIARTRIAPDDAGFQFGYGVFETLLARDGAPLFVADHLARLRDGAEALGIAAAIDERDVRADVAALLEANGLLAGEARIKIILTPGSLPAGHAPAAGAARRAASPVVVLLADRYHRRNPRTPFTLWLPGEPTPAAVPGHKTLNRLQHRLLRQQAEQRGCDDAVLLDFAGRPCETTTGGLLAHAGGRWRIPPPEGRLDSITLRHAVDLLRDRGQAAASEPFTRETLLDAEDVWVTNSLAGIVPVHSINGRPLPSPRRADAEELTAALFALGAGVADRRA